jgi:two-component system KDP operon response regulator KdpE
MDGIETCRRIREWADMPIIILSVRGDEKDKVKALDEGADDYITKPFGIEELLARIRVALRRSMGVILASPVFTTGDITIDLAKRDVRKKGAPIKLTRTEYELLAYLVSNHGKVLTHRELLHSVWGTEYGEESEYVRTFITQLRRKLEDDPSNPQFIITEPRIGYRFVKQE